MKGTNSIMIIDDDMDDRMIFSRSLKNINSGILFHEASNGADGILKLLSLDKLPDYLFVDVNMPNMSGFEFLTKIRSIERLKNLRVIIYTTSNQKSTIDTARNLGANGFLTKPEAVEELTNYISKLLNLPETSSFIQVGLLVMFGAFLFNAFVE